MHQLNAGAFDIVRLFLFILTRYCRYVFTLSKAWFYIDFILLVLYGNTTRNVI